MKYRREDFEIITLTYSPGWFQLRYHPTGEISQLYLLHECHDIIRHATEGKLQGNFPTPVQISPKDIDDACLAEEIFGADVLERYADAVRKKGMEPKNEVGMFDFSSALHLLMGGQKVARRGWNGKNMFIYLVPGSEFEVSRPPLLGIYPEGTKIKYLPHIDMRTADGSCVPWLASQTDILAYDWTVVN